MRKGLLSYTEGLELAREELSEMKQDRLAEKLESEGIEAYKSLRFRVDPGGKVGRKAYQRESML